MAVAAATIIAALLGGTATLIGSGLASKEQERAREESRGLADISRADTLAQQEAQRKLQERQISLSRLGLAQGQRQFEATLAQQKQENMLGRRERSEERAYGRKADVFNNAITLFNRDTSLRDQVAQRWGR